MFEINQKVVCVDGKFHPLVAALYTALPQEGVVYVIRDIRLGIRPDCRTGDVSVLLVGLINPPAASHSKLERGFSETRFQPLQSRTDAEPQAEVNTGAEHRHAPQTA